MTSGPITPLCRSIELTGPEIATRVAFLRLGRADREHLRRIRRLIAADIDSLIEEFEEHLSAFEATAGLVAGLSPDSRLALRQHLLGLGKGFDQPDYFEQRLRIGLIHQRVGVTPPYYLGAYQILFECIARRVTARPGSDQHQPSALLLSLHKVITLDSSLAVEMYHYASNERLEELVEQLELTREQLEQTARIDELTGVLNRRAVVEALDLELHRAQRTGQCFALALMDIDHFKAVNDHHGHAFGDLVLCQVARLARSALRPWDVYGRLGGDEFVAGLVSCSPLETDGVAERIRRRIAALRVERGNTTVGVTISIGVAGLRDQETDVTTLLEEADQALYRAKESGRNRTCQAERTGDCEILMP